MILDAVSVRRRKGLGKYPLTPAALHQQLQQAQLAIAEQICAVSGDLEARELLRK